MKCISIFQSQSFLADLCHKWFEDKIYEAEVEVETFHNFTRLEIREQGNKIGGGGAELENEHENVILSIE